MTNKTTEYDKKLIDQANIKDEISLKIIDYFGLGNPFKSDKIQVGSPVYNHREIINVLNCLLEGRISMGKYVKLFESEYSKYITIEGYAYRGIHSTACNSGSSANLLALAALKEEYEIQDGAEVICPASTFATVAMPIIQLNMVPVYVDVDVETLNIIPVEIEKAVSDRTAIIMPVHSLGLCADMPRIMRIAADYNLLVLEDCCEAHGSKIGSHMAGTWGDVATISFHVAHNITTGEGGMVFTPHEYLDKIIKQLREFGRYMGDCGRFNYTDPEHHFSNYDTRYIFERTGWNLRMTDITASLGLAQLGKLNELNVRRRIRAKMITEELKKYSDILLLPKESRTHYHTYYGYNIAVKDNAPFTRDDLCKYLEEQYIETRPFFAGVLPNQPGLRNKPKKVLGGLPNSKWIKDHTFFVGCHGNLTVNQTKSISRHIIEFIESKE
jgi:CDP-6-deoxy-D-xylo-4-hexulose-3-dehydrase